MGRYWKTTEKRRELAAKERRAKILQERLTKQLPIRKAREYRREIQNLNRAITLRKRNLELLGPKWDTRDKLLRSKLTDRQRERLVEYMKRFDDQGHPTTLNMALRAKNLAKQVKANEEAFERLSSFLDPIKEAGYDAPESKTIDKTKDIGKKRIERDGQISKGKSRTTRTRAVAGSGTKSKTVKAAKPVKAKAPVKAKSTRQLYAEHMRIKKAREGIPLDERDILLNEYELKVRELERKLARAEAKAQGVQPGESLAENIAKAADGTRDTYGDLIERVNRDPLYFQSLSERTKMSLLKSPQFHDVVFKEANPRVVERITKEDIYKQLHDQGYYDRFNKEIREEWIAQGRKGKFEDEFIKQAINRKKFKK